MDKAPIRVLLIEDNPVDIIFLREALDRDALNSFDITAVERLLPAMETLQKRPFDIILLDLGLPDSQGLETFTRINQAVPEMPKVILSGLTDENFALQAVQAGAQDYIVKATAGFSIVARAICYAIERQKAQTALRASEERFRAMIENGLDDISLLDANGTLLWESPSVIRNLGYPVDTFVGQNIFGIVHPDDRGWTSDLYTKVLQTPGSREAGTFRLQHANGSWRWIEAIVTNMVNNPSMKAVVVNYRDITERKHAEEALRVSETRYRGIFDGVQDAIFVESIEGEILEVNRRACEIYGYTRAEFLTKKAIDIVPSEEYLIRLWEDENVSLEHSYETINVRANGEQFPVEIRCGFYEFDGSKLFLIVLRDITERKKSEIMIGQQNNDLKLINAINEAVVHGVNLNKTMDLLAKEMKRIFSIEGTSIYMLDPDGQSLALQQFFLSPELTRSIEKVIGSTVPLIHIPIKEGSYFQKFIRAGHGTIMSNPEDIQKWMAEFVETSFLPPTARSAARKLIPQIYKLMHIKSTIIVPLISNGKTIGLLSVSSPNPFINEDLLRIENICGQLTTAIQRQQANEKIQKSEEFLNSVQNALSANLAILDDKGNIVRVNAAWRKFGEQNGLMDPNSCVGLNYLDVCDSARGPYAEEARITADAIRAVIAGHIREASIEYPCHSLEEKRWFLLRITKFDDGDHIWVVLAHENITKRKQAEDAVRETSEQFQILFEASPEAIMLVDPTANWSILDCNTMSCTMNGYTRDELIGQSVNIFNLTPGDPDERSAYLENIRKTGVLHIETSHRRKDGTVFPIEVTTSLITLGGREVVLGIDRDITERKKGEQSLHESEHRYRALFEDMPVAIWEEDFSEVKKYLDSLKSQGITDFREYFASYPEAVVECSNRIRILDVNNEALQMYRADSKEELIKSTYQEMSQGEKEHNIEDFIAIAEGSTRNSWEGGEETLTGEPIEISLSWSVVPGYETDFSKVIVTTTDITERKQAEAKLRESEARFASIFHTNPTRVSITSFEDSRFLDVNESFLASSGYSRQEVIGQTSDSLNDWVDPQDRIRLRALLEEQGSVQNFETQLRRKSGEILDILISAELVDLFSQRCILSVGLDITDRKRDEQKLMEANERFNQLADNIEEVFWITDAVSGQEIYISPAGEKLWGYSTQDQMQALDVFINSILPEDRPEVLRTIEKQRKGERTEMEYRVVQSDGSAHWIWDRAFPIFDDSGKVVRLAGIAADVTERKRTEREFKRHLAELEALYENGLAVGSLLDRNEIGERIMATFARHLSWHHVAIRLIEPDGAEMKLIAFDQEGLRSEELSAVELHLKSKISVVGQGLSGWVAQTGQPLRTGNVRAEDRYIATFPNIQSGLYMPLKIGAICIGVISVESDMPNAFTEQDERLLATLANQAAIAFENARLYEIVQQELDERTRAETALRASETHYRELTDSITDVFFEMDRNLCYTHWNKASELLTGIPEVSALGRSMHEIMGVSEEQTRIEKIYESVLLSQHPTTFETHFNFNNLVSVFEGNAYPSSRGVAVVAKDVTERKRSETIMQKRFELMEYANQHTLEETMQKTIDEVSDLTGSTVGFFHMLEADQTSPGLQIWSTNILNFFNVAASEGWHRSVEQAGVWADAVRQRRAIIHNDYESLPNKKGLPSGHAAIIREMVIPIIRSEKILAVLGVGNKSKAYTQADLEIAERFADYAWDITERKRMEMILAEEHDQLAVRVDERTADLSRANANLARALRVKDEFLANMSHELRTPLNAILGLSESLAEQTAGPLNEKQQRYITTVSESGHHLLALINDILDLAKIEAGQIELDVNKVDIQSICDASMRMIKQLARKKNQDTVLEIEGKLGLMWADERRLKQMLVNLLSNAVKFTPEGGKLGLEVHGDLDENKVTFTVWDTGIGIKETDLPRLFQPFVQLDAGLARESSGTGLGLALVAQMARMHGGSARVVSEPGKGSRFSIMMPWEPALAVDTVERLKITGKFKAVKFNRDHKPTILLIEDTEEVIMMISDYLELNGFRVVSARDGIEGVTQAQLTHPDLILMDIQMPRMDGFEAAKKLRSAPDFKRTPIIALTALAMPNDRERCLAAGMDEYITKPVHLRALVKIIENFLAGDMEVNPQ